MSSPLASDPVPETPPPPPSGRVGEPNFATPPQLIAEFVGLSDFPRCVLGAHVDIGGSVGVVVDIVNQSLKVRSRDGATQSFNFNRLRTIYGPPPEPVEAQPFTGRSTRDPEPPTPATAPSPPREVIETPDFEAPIRPIAEFIQRSDFPKCALGAHVEIAGYTGVVVEIVNQSLKVRAVHGLSRSYNADGLRRIHGAG